MLSREHNDHQKHEKHSRHEARSRSRSPRRHHHESRDSARRRHHGRENERSHPYHKSKRELSLRRLAPSLPYNAQPIAKQDLHTLKPFFAEYLDIQKWIVLGDLSERELKGRWKSFVEKWNRGELAEGWYDPATKATSVFTERPDGHQTRDAEGQDHDDDDDNDEDFGPALPEGERRRRTGPTVPNMQDLEMQREQAREDALEERDDARYAQKLDRKKQRERLDELVPRAEPGTRERQLEKKRETNEKMRSFREKSPTDEVPDADLMGDAGGVDAVKREHQEQQRKKNERELRREEILRARAEEREEKLRVHREKEEQTMSMLKVLAKQRFG